jgi:hypothetical protein
MFAYYELWISPSKVNNQSQPQVHEKENYQSSDFIQINWVSKIISPSIWKFRIWASKTEIPPYKQQKIEESSNL